VDEVAGQLRRSESGPADGSRSSRRSENRTSSSVSSSTDLPISGSQEAHCTIENVVTTGTLG
jgi:hypothetical protein